MELVIVSWNSLAINDSNPYQSTFPPGQRVNLMAQGVTVPRANLFPYLSTRVLKDQFIQIRVIIAATDTNSIPTYRELLKAYFDVTDNSPHNLICKDINDGDRQWYLRGFPVEVKEQQAGMYFVRLQLETPIWQLVTAGSTNWSVTASGQTQAITALGNVPVPPVFTITPTVTKTGGLSKGIWIPVYNPMSSPFIAPLEITDGGIDTAALVTDTSKSNQINVGGGITNSATSWAIDTAVGGGLPVGGGSFIMDSEQCSYISISAGTINGVVRGIGGTTPATHGDNTVMNLSHMQVNGNDFLVWKDGGFVDRWLDGMNTATTRCLINVNLPPLQSAVTATSIAGAGGITTITLAATRASRNFLSVMKKSVNKVVIIDSEAFTFTGVNLITYQLTGVTRQAKGTSNAAHAAPKTVYWIPIDLWILYKDPALGAPDIDDTLKPMCNLDSDNALLNFTNYFDDGTNRPFMWQGEVNTTKTGLSYVFTDNENTQVDPSTELGIALRNPSDGTLLQQETGQLDWLFNHPSGITDVSYSGKKYFYATAWPAIVGLQYLEPGAVWVTAQNEAIPAVESTWEAFSQTVALGATYNSIRFAIDGSLSFGINSSAMVQFDTVVLTIDSTNLPVIALTVAQDINFFNITLANNTTSESLTINAPCPLNVTMTIDCSNKELSMSNGERFSIQLSSDRADWLNLNDGANTLQWTDVGTNGVTVGISHRDRTL